MITSHRIAEEKCSLLFTILERSGLQSVVCTILASFPDLLVRHPNTMEPWTKVGLKNREKMPSNWGYRVVNTNEPISKVSHVTRQIGP